jgi:predicted nucleic acid-binding protein
MRKGDPRPRVVFDCMIFLQATASESGPAAALLRLVERNVLSLLVSREILDEVRDVLSRSKIRRNNPDITDDPNRRYDHSRFRKERYRRCCPPTLQLCVRPEG